MRRIVAVLLAVAFAVTGSVILSGSPAAALACYSSLTCNPANLPILAEAGMLATTASGTTVTGAGTTAVIATGTVATGGGFAAGISGATTLYAGAGAVGAATAAVIGSAVMTSLGVQGVKLKTTKGSGGSSVRCPVPVVDGTSPRTIPEANCTTSLVVRYGAAVSDGYTTEGQPKQYDMTRGAVTVSDQTVRIAFALTPSGSSGEIATFLPLCAYDAGENNPVQWTSASNPPSDGVGTAELVCNTTVSDRPLIGAATRISWTKYTRLYQMLWTPNFTEENPGYKGQLRTTVQCAGRDGTTPVSATKRVDQEGGLELDTPDATCPAGDLAVSFTVDYLADGSTTWLPLTTGDSTGEVKNLVQLYPDCFGPGVSPCRLDLQTKVGDTSWASCGAAAVGCPDWVSQAEAAPDRYRCKYGKSVLELDYCSAYRRPGSVLPNTKKAPDGTPVRVPITAPVPPATSAPLKVTDTTGQTVELGKDGSPAGSLGDGSSDCWQDGWGTQNPLTWVLTPVQCAFRWAFIPRESVVADFQTTVTDAYNEAPPGKVQRMVAGVVPDVPPSGCSGITLDLTGWRGLIESSGMDRGVWSGNVTLLAACEGDQLRTAAIATNVILSAVIVFMVFRTWPRLIGRMFGYGGVDGR